MLGSTRPVYVTHFDRFLPKVLVIYQPAGPLILQAALGNDGQKGQHDFGALWIFDGDNRNIDAETLHPCGKVLRDSTRSAACTSTTVFGHPVSWVCL